MIAFIIYYKKVVFHAKNTYYLPNGDDSKRRSLSSIKNKKVHTSKIKLQFQTTKFQIKSACILRTYLFWGISSSQEHLFKEFFPLKLLDLLFEQLFSSSQVLALSLEVSALQYTVKINKSMYCGNIKQSSMSYGPNYTQKVSIDWIHVLFLLPLVRLAKIDLVTFNCDY